MSNSSIKKNAFYSFLKAFMTLVLPLIAFPYVSRILKPEGIGKVNFANTVIFYFNTIACLGVIPYGTREVALIKDDKIKLVKFTKEILSILAISTSISYIIFLLCLFTVPKFYDYRLLLLIVSSLTLGNFIGIEWFYIGREDFKFITLRSFIFQILSLIYLFIFVRTKNDVIHYAIYGVIASFGCSILNLINLFRIIPFKTKVKLNIKQHIKPIITFFGMSIASSLYSSMDILMIGFLSNDLQIGYYSAATKINKMVVTLITTTSAVLLPKLAEYINDNKIDEFSYLTKKSVNIISIISIPMCFGLIILAKPIIYLLCGSEYLVSVGTMNLMNPIVIFIAISNLCIVQILPAIKKEKFALLIVIFGFLTNFIANFILIPKYGAKGAAIGTLSSEFIVMIIPSIYLRKEMFSADTVRVISQSLVSSLFMSFVLYYFLKINLQVALQVILSILIGILIYALILLVFRNKELFEILNKIKDRKK